MKSVLGITIIAILALLGSRWTFTRVRLPLGARHIFFTGTEYILVGVCLGPLLLGLMDEPTLHGLQPLLDLSLGWIGLMFGAQLDHRQVARFPRPYLLATLTQGLITWATCLLPFIFLGGWIPTLSAGPFVVALAIASTAVPTGQSSLALIQQESHLRPGAARELLRYNAGMDAVVGLVSLGVLFCLPHRFSLVGLDFLIPAQYMLLTLGLGALIGKLLHILTRFGCSQAELLLFMVGGVAFNAGAASYLMLSPLFVNLISGILIANVRGEKVRILRVLTQLEKPIYLVVLLFAGALIRPAEGAAHIAVLIALYIGVRGAGKVAGGFVAGQIIGGPVRLPRLLGLGLLSQGGMAVAMVVSFRQAFQGTAADTILLIVLGAIAVNELISPSLVTRAVGKVA